MKHGSACCLLHAGFLLDVFFNLEDGGDVPSIGQLIFKGLHSVVSQKIELFMQNCKECSLEYKYFRLDFKLCKQQMRSYCSLLDIDTE
jgi:hypothetical protein